MTRTARRCMHPLPLRDVAISGGFWGPRLETVRAVTLAIEFEQLRKNGQLDALKLKWEPGRPGRPHHFWDSDIAKWIEAASCSLAAHPDPGLRRRVDRVVDLLAKAQQPDGYLNSYYTVVAPRERWTNLNVMHELYCAGHLMEAAVAHSEATGSSTFLDIMCRYADHIDKTFGPRKGQKRGYPGHEEIELALVKLYRATGEKRYLDLAMFFVDERGRSPHYFDLEAERRGVETDPRRRGSYVPWDYCQAHLPVREQTTAEGHAVRAVYLYSGMADVAMESGDAALQSACAKIWSNITERRMYVTGGIGSSGLGERFTVDYDLPNRTAYCETCAAIGLVFFAQRMLELTADGRYADVMERCLYNGTISGLSLDGKKFFYRNPLESHGDHHRQDWYGCACCPPNIARLLTSLGHYVYGRDGRTLYVNLFVQGRAEVDVAGQAVRLTQKTGYPWKGGVRITVETERPVRFEVAVRIPAWCRRPELSINGETQDVASLTRKGFARIRRTWQRGDAIALKLPMPVERVRSHPRVTPNAGRVALQRDPVVYCLEQTDNGPDLNGIVLPRTAKLTARFDHFLLGGVTVISGRGRRAKARSRQRRLYQSDASVQTDQVIKAVPYYAWDHRTSGEMLVWIRHD